MSDDTMRPHVEEELAAAVDDAVREHVRIPPDRLTFADRVRVLLEEYHDTAERVEHLEEQLQSRENRVEALEEQVAELQSGGVLRS